VSGVEIGNAILVVATEEHRHQLRAALEQSGINPLGLEAEGRLQLLDSRELLDQFMVEDLPSRKLFLSKVGAVVKAAKQTSWNMQRGLTVFGEMVAVLTRQHSNSNICGMNCSTMEPFISIVPIQGISLPGIVIPCCFAPSAKDTLT